MKYLGTQRLSISTQTLVQALSMAPLILFGALGAPADAGAEPATVTTTTFTDTISFESSALICSTGPLYNLTLTIEVVDHIVETKSGEGLHNSFKVTESFTGTPKDNPELPTVTGGATCHGTFNRDLIGAAVFTQPCKRRVTYSDGTEITENILFHFTIQPDNDIKFIEQCKTR